MGWKAKGIVKVKDELMADNEQLMGIMVAAVNEALGYLNIYRCQPLVDFALQDGCLGLGCTRRSYGTWQPLLNLVQPTRCSAGAFMMFRASGLLAVQAGCRLKQGRMLMVLIIVSSDNGSCCK